MCGEGEWREEKESPDESKKCCPPVRGGMFEREGVCVLWYCTSSVLHFLDVDGCWCRLEETVRWEGVVLRGKEGL